MLRKCTFLKREAYDVTSQSRNRFCISLIKQHFVLTRSCFVTGLCLQGGRNQDKGTEKGSGTETG